MNSLFFQPKSQILLRSKFGATEFVRLINNQLLSTANAKDIYTDYYITNSLLASRYHGSVATKNERVRSWAGSDVFF